ncbi:DUF1684 domain-containing protein [Apibacter sp. HY039]|uniref:DUF1684 domain-containing protein n=1 Tax=Apibacter sp. HY039 TaxID=2501476 RepID=UPI0013E344A5|nr:DUF1684 domain-containing protein [Apibacter sp. HY039]
MKTFGYLFFSILILNSCSVNKSRPALSAAQYQAELKEHYDGPNTPLKKEDIADFKGLNFFPIDSNFIVQADFIRLNSSDIYSFKTSKNLYKKYLKYGRLTFELNGKTNHLYLYQPFPLTKHHKDYLFLPFRDLTTGISSYGAGRYLDFSKKSIVKNKIIIDFNKSYNPYCAYSRYYSCPMAPSENTLTIAIEAGIKYDYSVQIE